MQGSPPSDWRDANEEGEGNCSKTESDTDWLFPLLWRNWQYRKNYGVPISGNEKFILLAKQKKPEEKL